VSGKSTRIARENRRTSAGSRVRAERSGASASSAWMLKLVAASTNTGRRGSGLVKPSISVSSAFRVFSSARPEAPPARTRPIASISSMKTMAGA